MTITFDVLSFLTSCFSFEFLSISIQRQNLTQILYEEKKKMKATVELVVVYVVCLSPEVTSLSNQILMASLQCSFLDVV